LDNTTREEGEEEEGKERREECVERRGGEWDERDGGGVRFIFLRKFNSNSKH
jgi:hypothetical protein